jgi:predicted transcriptional regulator
MEAEQGAIEMRVMTIGIKSEKEAMKEFEAAFCAAQNRSPFKAARGVYFTSLEAARKFLTPRRLEILHSIKERAPKSLYELAKTVRRSFPSVLRDVEILSRHGLVKLTRTRESVRQAIHPRVGYDAINLWIAI